MPELPDITIYLEALERRILGQTLTQVHLKSPFLLRTAVPSISTVYGRKVVMLRRRGKRIVFGFEGKLWQVLHLMIAGRLHWRETPTEDASRATSTSMNRAPTPCPSTPVGKRVSPKRTGHMPNLQAAFNFTNG